jgi:chlorobactene glucosyltransferase
MILLLSTAWAALVAGLIARAIVQFRGYRSLTAATVDDAPLVLVIVPARNESQNIGRCLSGLLAQDYSRSQLRVAVIDDHSQDDTAQIVRRFAAADERCRLIQGQPLPPGWTGKSFACWQGAASESASSEPDAGSGPASWLCFLDADTTPEPGLIAATIAHCRDERLDLLSVEPFQQLGTFWERMILPSGMLLLAFSQDLRRVNDPADPAAAANGQFLLFRRSAYEAIGGHAAVRTEICEDTALARRIKRRGLRMQLVGGENFISTRMYTGLRPLWEGLSKNLTETVGGPMRTLVLAAAGLLLGWAVPLIPAAAAIHLANAGGPASTLACVLAGCGSLALLGMQIGTLRHLRAAWWHALLLPIAYTVAAALACHAVWKRWRGCVAWKGRTYETAAPSAAGHPAAAK